MNMFSFKFSTACQQSASAVHFSTASALNNVKNLRNCNRIMNKLLGKEKPRKSYSFNAIPVGGPSEFVNYISGNKSSGKVNHRLIVLNKVFMKNITDIMSTGEICPEICNRGVQISKVKVTPTFHQINVHWLANGTVEDDKTQVLLSKLAPKLRHELSQLRIMGAVPKIEFVKDVSAFKYMQVEDVLRTADYGDDYEITPLGHDWKSEYLAQTAQEETNNDENRLPLTTEAKSLPAMRMDVYGLKHDFIMSKVNISVQKAKAMHRRDLRNHPTHSASIDLIDEHIKTIDDTERRKLLQEYFQKKMIERKKMSKVERKNRPEYILRQQEMESRYASDYLKALEEEDEFKEEFDRSDSYVEDSDYSVQNK